MINNHRFHAIGICSFVSFCEVEEMFHVFYIKLKT